jgi:WD40 repeat protein/serine/threonine protein kinase
VTALSDEKSIFVEALEKATPHERATFLDRACGGDESLRRRVDALLLAHERQPGLLDGPPPGVAQVAEPTDADATAAPLSDSRIGSVVGRYKLLEQIGEGGMGVVYLAEQVHPVRRRVALKIIKPGMDTRQVIARFEAERQALAMMDHPSIARVLDAGATDAGRPYFVMELVRGVPITEYCDQQQLTTRQRLELFVHVCHAVQHAHAKGVIHRDLKPNNVLVTHVGPGGPGGGGDTPIPKVIDFGIAKAAADQHLTDRTLFTEMRQLVGTPLYMSPEQAEMSAVLDVDTRSDVYSLGVLLYELLTGTTPFEKERLARAAVDELRRIIREEEPPRPSTRLSTLGETLATVSQRRHTDPKRLGEIVRGELDWIVMRAMEKDRGRRYETAVGLAHDVQRYLADEPVNACPPSRVYRLRKFVRRNRPAIATAAVVAIALLLGTTVSAWQAVRARRAENAVARERDQVVAAKQIVDAQERMTRRHLYASHINLAQQAWEAADIKEVTRLLDLQRPRAGEEDLRGFEWRYLQGLCNSHAMALPEQPAPVKALAASPDGRTLATGSGRTVRTWDTATGQQVHELPAMPGEVRALTFSPDGTLLAIAAGDAENLSQIRLWDVVDRRMAREPWEMSETVLALAFRPDGKALVVGSAKLWKTAGNPDSRILTMDDRQQLAGMRVLDLDLGAEQPGFAVGTGGVLTVAFSPDGHTIAAGSWDGTVSLWDARTRRRIATSPPLAGRVWSVAFSPDGASLASGSGDWQGPADLRLWSARTLEVGPPLHGHHDGVTSVAFSSDGQSLATSSFDRTVRLWNLRTGRQHNRFRGHLDSISRVAFVANGRLVSASWDGFIKFWDATATQGETALSREETGGLPESISYSPDGRSLAVAGGEDARLIDLRARNVRHTLRHPGCDVIARSPDGKLLATAGSDRIARIWDAQSGALRRELKRHDAKIWSIAFSGGGELLATGDWFLYEDARAIRAKQEPAAANGSARVWDVASGALVREYRTAGRFVSAVAFGPDAKSLITGEDRPHGLTVWDLRSGQQVRHVATGAGRIQFTRDGKTMVTSDAIWNADTWEVRRTLVGHSAEHWDVAISPDEKTIATSSWDGTVRLWNLATGDPMLTLPAQRGVVWSVEFSPDGSTLAAGSGSLLASELRFWHTTTQPATKPAGPDDTVAPPTGTAPSLPSPN